MPKVFRPTIKQIKPQVKANEQEVQEDGSNQMPDSHSVKETPPCVITTEPVASPDPPSKDVLKNPEADVQRSTDLDSCVRVTADKSKPSGEIVNLFVSKKSRKVKTKTTEVMPPVDQPLDRSSVTLRSLLHWIPINKPPPTYRQDRLNSTTCSVNGDLEASDSDIKLPEDNSVDLETKENSPKNSPTEGCLDLLAPQLRIDANGNIVLDESSLVVQKKESVDIKTLRYVNEETGILNVTYNSFRPPRNNHGRKWTERETTRFYRALSTIGTDFYLMERMFPRRKRSELVSKFKREEKRNPYLVNQALRNRRSYDLINLLPSSDEDEVGKNISTKKSKRSKCDQDSVSCSEQSYEQDTDKPSRPKSRRKKSTLPPNPHFGDHLSDTIDFVLSQNVNSDVSDRESDSVQHNQIDQPRQRIVTHRYSLRRSTCNVPTLQKMISVKEAELAASEQESIRSDLDSSQLPTPEDSSSKASEKKVPKPPKSYYRPKIDLFELRENILGDS